MPRPPRRRPRLRTRSRWPAKPRTRPIVLLKNDKHLLPLDPAKIRRMAVIGTHARDTPIGGYSDVPSHVVSVLEGMQEAGEGQVRGRLCRRRAHRPKAAAGRATR